MKVHLARIMTFDSKFNQLVGINESKLTTPMTIITLLGSGPFWLAVYACVFVFGPQALRSLLYVVVEAELALFVIIPTLRYLTHRQRPRPDCANRFLDPWNRYSFPSHHAARMIMLSVMCGAFYRWSLAGMLPAAALIAFSRLYLEKHYLSDVLAGAAIGGLTAATTLLLHS